MMKRNKERIISSLLTAILCMNIMFPDVSALAGENSNVIYISSAKDLISLAKKCSLDTWSRGKTVILCNDIDLTGTEFTSIPVFDGTFDGQGYTISGLSLTGYNSPLGLFRYIDEGALVKNLTVNGTVAPAGEKSIIGGVAGSNSGTILNCIFIGTVIGDKYVGGIAGINEAKGLISNCSTHGIMNGKHYVGGIAGENLGTILLSTNEANVNTTVTENSLNLEDIQNLNTRLISLSTENFLDVTDVGGIAGISGGIIQSCLNHGTIGYPHVGYNIGGIAGRQSGYLNGCTNKGIIYGRKDVGGIAGQIEPYSTWRFSENILEKLRKELNTLQVLVNNAINDSNRENSEISSQLTRIHEYVTDARIACDSLADQTSSWLNGNIGSVNDVSARITETLVAMESIMDSFAASINNMEKAIEQYKNSMQQLESTTGSTENGLDTIYPALDEMKKALENTGDSVDMISDALASLKKGLGDSSAVEKALLHMHKGMTELITATGKISDTAKILLDASDILVNSEVLQENAAVLREGASELVTAENEMADAILKIKNALNTIKGDFDEDELSAALASLENAVAALATAVDKSAYGFSKISSGLEKFVNTYEDNEETRQAWQDIKNGLKTVEEAIKDRSGIDYEAVLKGLAMVQKSLAVLIENTDTRKIHEGLTDIYNGVQDLFDAMKIVQESVGDVQDMIAHLQAANTNLGKAVKDLKPLMNGFANLAAGTQKAADALLKINIALNRLLQSDEAETYRKVLHAYIRRISDSVSEITDALKKINYSAKKLSEQVDLDELGESIKYMKKAAGDISCAVSHMQKAISYVQDAWPYLKAAEDSVSNALSSAIEATTTLRNSAADMAEAVKEISDLISGLAAQPKITFNKPESEYMEARAELSKALGNISDSLSVLNSTISDASGTLLADIQAVSNQMFALINLFADTFENVSDTGTDIRDYIEDISAQDPDSDTGGKAANSINYGTIQGDVNAGGISGSIAIEYDFDLEDDHNLTEKISPGSKYLLRAVISGCENYGNITSKKNHAGGIVGLMDFGYVVQSVNNGSISSISGDYVGGIAGKSNGTIRRCYTKSSLSGDDYIGGIAGYGTDIYNCYSLIQVEKANEFVGTIAGYADGVLHGNYFVNDEFAGINGISYEGKAEPISYEELISVKGLPETFRTFRLTFVSDGNEVAVIPFRYGETIPADKIPDVPEKNGYFGEWDMFDFTNLTFDVTVEAVYTQYITTMASNQTRDDGLSVILVDGLFTKNSVLATTELETEDYFKGEKVLEKRTVSISDDGQASHTVRYLAPGRRTCGINIYLLKDGKWEKTEYKTTGSYLIFTMDGTEETFIVTSSKNNAALIILGTLVALLIVALLWVRRKKFSVIS